MVVDKEDITMNTFINFTNHGSEKWSQEQIQAANAYGDIVDIPFPAVNSSVTQDDIKILAEKCVNEIMSYNPACVLCQGELTLAYSVIKELLSYGIKVVAACSDRNVKEVIKDGVTKKTAVFEFVQFREYI